MQLSHSACIISKSFFTQAQNHCQLSTPNSLNQSVTQERKCEILVEARMKKNTIETYNK